MWLSECFQPSYLSVIQNALVNEQHFRYFKSNAVFLRVVGMTEMGFMAHCLNAPQSKPEVLANFPQFKLNDSLGTPLQPYGVMAGDTARFVETVCHIIDEFKTLSNKTVLDFGSNYGGQAFMALQQWPDIQRYHLLDLPVVQQLSLKYLNRLGVDMTKVSIEEPVAPVDLAISSYSLTEFTDDDLYSFYDKYFRNAANIYLRCNLVDQGRYLRFLNTLREDFSVTVEKEPNYRHPNCIIAGKK